MGSCWRTGPREAPVLDLVDGVKDPVAAVEGMVG
jgi:hypothetical protein